ncbi:MAG: group III truncated hemoglobin [Pseudomonadota bacterium]
MSDQLSARGAIVERKPAHPSITAEQISNLVDSFYGRVRSDSRLAPIFEQRVSGNWPSHLAKMKQFWSSVLLRTGEYKGKPVPAHAKLKEVQTEDFVIWLNLFRATVAETFEPEAQPIVIEAAERIASSLWLAVSGNLLKSPPDWS